MARVMCAGVAVVDFVLSVEQMPVAPEKYRAYDGRMIGGGPAATGAVAVVRLGGAAALAARIGADPIGALIVDDLESEGVDCSAVRRIEGARSSFSSVLIDRDGERIIVNYRDPSLAGEADWIDDRTPAFDVALADTRWPLGAETLIALARRRGAPAVLDAEEPVAPARAALGAASHVVFSATGLREHAGEQDLHRALASAQRAHGGFVAVTDGARGVLWRDGSRAGHEPALDVCVVDTLGAGDVWHGAFALALGEGMDSVRAIRFASATAALKCSRPGGRAGAPCRAEVDALLGETQAPWGTAR